MHSKQEFSLGKRTLTNAASTLNLPAHLVEVERLRVAVIQAFGGVDVTTIVGASV